MRAWPLIGHEDYAVNKAAYMRGLLDQLGWRVRNDVTDRVDLQFQPTGTTFEDPKDAFSPSNLEAIMVRCKSGIRRYYPQLLEGKTT